MTYAELYEQENKLLEIGVITLGEYEEMTKPLNEEVRTWISVSERMPKLEEKVLIFTTDKEYHVAYRRYKEWQNIKYEWFIFGLFGASLAYDEEEVIAWMPLPKPYNTESEDKE